VALSKPSWWFNEIVVPNYKEFLFEELSQRRAFNAIVTTYHMWERLYWYYEENKSRHLRGMSKPDFYTYLKSQCIDLDLLRGSVNAVKHTYRTSPGLSVATATGQAVLGSGSLGWDVLVIEPTGREVKDVLTKIAQFWSQWLKDHPDP
jgi:hypothetical protein